MARAPHHSSFIPSPTHAIIASCNDPDGAPARRAVRRSCDRCHAQKLKCSANNAAVGRDQCQRCQQAGLKCVYSERSAKRKLQKANAGGIPEVSPRAPQETTTTTTAAAAAATTTTTTVSSPASPSSSVILEDTLSTESAAAFDPLHFVPGGWPWSGINSYEANNTHSLGASDLEYKPTGPLHPPEPASPSPFDFPLEKQYSASSNHGDTTGRQRSLFVSLSEVSQELESILLGMTVEWHNQEIWNYPIGRILNAFSRLLAHLKQHTHTSTGHSMLDGCLQTKNRFMAVHCYMLSVKILTALSDLLLSQILNAQERHPTVASPAGWYQSSSVSSRGSSSSRSDESIGEVIPAFHSNLHIGELFSHLNPFMHALSSACTTLRVSLRLLRENEIALGISPAQGVAASIYSTETAGINTSNTAFPSLLDEETLSTPASRLISALWSDEEGEDEAESNPQGRTLAVLRRCYREIFYLARKHNMVFQFD